MKFIFDVSVKNYFFNITILFFFLLLNVCIFTEASGQDGDDVDPDLQSVKQNLSPVEVDGVFLFYVRGISSFPAKMRAETISRRIEKAAANHSISSDSVKAIVGLDRVRIFAGTQFIMSIYEADVIQEGINSSILSEVITVKIHNAINDYRTERSKPVLIKHAIHAVVALGVTVIILLILIWLIKKIDNALQVRIKSKVESLQNKSFNLIRSNQFWKAFHILIKTLKVIIIAVVLAFFIQYEFGLFPWTKGFGVYLLELFTNPLVLLGRSMVGFLPSLAFLIVIFFVTRYFLKITKLLFLGISHGEIVLEKFDSDWAMPTFKIIRMVIVAFAIIIAYPYIPGSETSAFKGVSVFIGVLFSLGSSSFIGNVIAGYSMTYRGAFKKGDRIKVDDLVGFVEEQKLLVTRLRSVKNEEIIIPNSILLNSNIINYNTRSKNPGIILHTTVGIGYETPWRQVDAMLKLAADRTEGLLKEPPPYVLKKSLGDFAVNYEINAYCSDVPNMYTYYTVLHQNILDIFNENNVQIMTPAYEGDPETPKVVPKEQWNTPLAKDGSTE